MRTLQLSGTLNHLERLETSETQHGPCNTYFVTQIKRDRTGGSYGSIRATRKIELYRLTPSQRRYLRAAPRDSKFEREREGCLKSLTLTLGWVSIFCRMTVFLPLYRCVQIVHKEVVNPCVFFLGLNGF